MEKEKNNEIHSSDSHENAEDKYCEYCGRRIEDRNDTGSLCYRCYMKEYYEREY